MNDRTGESSREAAPNKDARGGTRTLKARRPPDFESDASAGSATRATIALFLPILIIPAAAREEQPPASETNFLFGDYINISAHGGLVVPTYVHFVGGTQLAVSVALFRFKPGTQQTLD